MVFEKDPEKQPLLGEDEKHRASPDSQDDDTSSLKNDDDLVYDARKLVTLSVLMELKGTVWQKGSLWKSLGFLVLIALTTAASCALLLKDPEKLNTEKFSKISGFLSVIVGMLLGFFLSSSVTRWYSCTNGFLELFDAIRSLQMQLNGLGVPKARQHMCIRYCIVSAYSLHYDLKCQTLHPEEKASFRKQAWQKMLTTTDELKDSSEAYAKKGSLAKVYENEMLVMNQVEDPSQTLWVWVTSLLTRMSQDGEVPPMPTPTYGRIIALAEKAYNGIREVRASVCIQPPYVYVQMMAMLVTINNIICAISFGMTFGVTLSAAMKRGVASVLGSGLQDVLIGFILSTVGPFLYQALLEVAVCIAQPFESTDDDDDNQVSRPGKIPTAQLLEHLEKDIRDAEFMANSTLYWEQPHFKQPAQ